MDDQDVFSEIRRIQIKTLREVRNLFGGAYRSSFKGQGIAFDSLREYQPGDEIRHIDWNVTARANTPFTKQFREERELTIFLIVDISASTLFGSTKSKNNLITQLGALLAFSALKNQDKVGLLLFSSEVELYLTPQKSLKHCLRVIRELLYFKPKYTGTDFSKALSYFGKVQKKSSICFLISDFLMIGLDDHLAALSKKHDLIAVRVEDPWEKSFPKNGLMQLSDLETGVEMVLDTSDEEVRQLIKQSFEQRLLKVDKTLKHFGIDQILINTQDSYHKTLHQFFKMRGARR